MNKSKHTEPLLSTQQAADLLGVSLRTVQLWVEKGALDAWKTPGGHRRVTQSSVERLLLKNQTQPVDNSVRILLAEDDELLKQLYSLQIESWDLPMSLQSVTNGIAGLLKIGEWAPQILISDLQMPELDGFQMIRELKLSPRHENMKIIVVTALTDAEIAAGGGLPESVQLMRKPLLLSDLKDRLEKLLQELR